MGGRELQERIGEGKGKKGRAEKGEEWEGDSFRPRSGPPTADLRPWQL